MNRADNTTNIAISEKAKEYAKEFLNIAGWTEEECNLMLYHPESFKEEWYAVIDFIRDTIDENDENDENEDYFIADEIEEVLSEI